MGSSPESYPVRWGRQTAREIRRVAERTGSVLVVPIGSMEQHGNHLPVATDTLLVEEVAVGGAETVADEIPVLVTPTVWTGYSPHHLPFGGTLSVEFVNLLDVVCDVVRTGLDNGFEAVLLLNGHGGNIPIIDAATSILGVDHPAARVFGLTYFHLADSFIDDIRDSDSGGMGHGGEFETSLMLYLYPELVDRAAIDGTALDPPSDYLSQDMFQRGAVSNYQPFSDLSDSGAIGDPTSASPEKGETIFDRTLAALADVLTFVHEEGSCATDSP